MKRTLLSLIALGAFATSFAGTIVKEVMRDPTIWVYQNGQTTSNPSCIGTGDPCATEYYLDANGDPAGATGNIRYGVRTN